MVIKFVSIGLANLDIIHLFSAHMSCKTWDFEPKLKKNNNNKTAEAA
jgi:hypothetical protein